MREPLDIVVLCGFLGSGKTTLLTEFLRSPHAGGTAVIVNEVGEIGIDGAVILGDASVPSVMLSNGCVCCSLTSDLVSTIEKVIDDHARRSAEPLRRVIIECSGLSRPAPIARALTRIALCEVRLRIVCTLDVTQGPAMLCDNEEAVEQLGSAHLVVLTKLDMADDVQRAAALAALRAINPLADHVDTRDERERARQALLHDVRESAGFYGDDGMPAVDPPPADVDDVIQHGRVQVFRVTQRVALAWDDIAEWLDDVADYCGARLLRIKGIVATLDWPAPVVIQSVGTVFSAPRRLRGAAAIDATLIIIARDVSLDALQALDGTGSLTVAAVRRAQPLFPFMPTLPRREIDASHSR